MNHSDLLTSFMIGVKALLRAGLHVCSGLGVETVSTVSVAKMIENSIAIKTIKYLKVHMMFDSV